YDIPAYDFSYSDELLNEIKMLCKDSDLVGISFMTNYYDRVLQLSDFLRKNLDIPLVLGGIHPTIRPEDCLDHADIIAIGEVDFSLPLLVDRMESGADYRNISGFWFKGDTGEWLKNDLPIPPQNLDEIEYPDYGTNNHFVLYGGKLQEMTPKLLEEFFTSGTLSEVMRMPYYIILTSRGCKFNCTYCNNNTLRSKYKGAKYSRHRSIEHVIGELEIVKRDMPFVKSILFTDDSLLDKDEEEIEEFSMVYKDRIGLSFYCLGTPVYITRKKLEYLIDAGLMQLQMGIQSGSERIQKLYRRPISNMKILETAKLINSFSDKLLPPVYDVITDNPFETDDDYIETFRLFLKIPRPFRIQLFYMTFLPGTEIYDKAVKEGIINDDISQVYRQKLGGQGKTFPNFLFNFFNLDPHIFILKFLTIPIIFKALNSPLANRIRIFAIRIGRIFKKK
ncbi:B12-binding domain-containing radical SAM protein, partial [bacterium]|nr:B12-binding domain-containing radical SAM protein [bacterium]